MFDTPGSFVGAFEPDERLGVIAWADRYRILSVGSGAETGKYHSARTPYLTEIMDCLSAFSPIRSVALLKGAQLGGTELGLNWIGSIISHNPAPTMIVTANTDLARQVARTRLEPLINDCPILRSKMIPARTRGASDTARLKSFVGGFVSVVSAGSPISLRSQPIRYLFLDEVDAYGAYTGDGDAIALAQARLATFGKRAKTFLCSTPTVRGSSRIEEWFEAGDQRLYFVPCIHCGAMQTLKWALVRWEPSKPETAHYQCVECGGKMYDHHKTEMLALGEWRAQRPEADPLQRSYRISALYSPAGWYSWIDAARAWGRSVENLEERRAFNNNTLAESWLEEVAPRPDAELLIARRETWPYQTCPLPVSLLTCGIDVQANRLEASVWGWSREQECWLIAHEQFFGDIGQPAVWAQLTELLYQPFEHASGKGSLQIRLACIDSGFVAGTVYEYARPHRRILRVIKGSASDRLPYSGPTQIDQMPGSGVKIRGGMSLWTVHTGYHKAEAHKFMMLPAPSAEDLAAGLRYPAGYVHISTDTPDTVVKQLVSERLAMVRTRHGFAHAEWQPVGAVRTEAWDCFVYARAALHMLGAHRWSAARWEQHEAGMGLQVPQGPRAQPPPPPPREPPQVVVSQPSRPQEPPRRIIGMQPFLRPRRRVRW